MLKRTSCGIPVRKELSRQSKRFLPYLKEPDRQKTLTTIQDAVKSYDGDMEKYMAELERWVSTQSLHQVCGCIYTLQDLIKRIEKQNDNLVEGQDSKFPKFCSMKKDC